MTVLVALTLPVAVVGVTFAAVTFAGGDSVGFTARDGRTLTVSFDPSTPAVRAPVGDCPPAFCP